MKDQSIPQGDRNYIKVRVAVLEASRGKGAFAQRTLDSIEGKNEHQGIFSYRLGYARVITVLREKAGLPVAMPDAGPAMHGIPDSPGYNPENLALFVN